MTASRRPGNSFCCCASIPILMAMIKHSAMFCSCSNFWVKAWILRSCWLIKSTILIVSGKGLIKGGGMYVVVFASSYFII